MTSDRVHELYVTACCMLKLTLTIVVDIKTKNCYFQLYHNLSRGGALSRMDWSKENLCEENMLKWVINYCCDIFALPEKRF